MERTFKLNFSLLPSENGGEAAAILRHMADEVEAVGTLEPCHWQNLNAPDFMRGKWPGRLSVLWKVEKNVED